MVLGKLSVPGRPTNLDNSRARAYCASVGASGVGLDIFLSSIISRLSPFYILKDCLKGPLYQIIQLKCSIIKLSRVIFKCLNI